MDETKFLHAVLADYGDWLIDQGVHIANPDAYAQDYLGGKPI